MLTMPLSQFLIAVTILGLAAAALAQQVYGSTPVTTRYSTFTGGWGMLVALVGVATLFISSAPPLVSMALDALAGLLFAAGGIVSPRFSKATSPTTLLLGANSANP